MSNYNSATVKLYAATDDLLDSPAPTPIATSTDPSEFYELDDLDAGEYFYTITGSSKGNILEYITVPNDDDFLSGNIATINTSIYPAAAAQTINIVDRDGEPIESGVILKVNNYPYDITSTNQFILSNIPRIPTGCLLEFIGTGFEPLRRKIGFPVTGNEITVDLYPPYGATVVNLRLNTTSGTIVNSSATSITVQYVDTTNLSGEASYIGDPIIIQKTSGNQFVVPVEYKHSGTLVLTGISSLHYKLGSTGLSANLSTDDGSATTINYVVIKSQLTVG